MIRKLLFLFACVATSVATWAEDCPGTNGIVSKTINGTTMTVVLHGDMTGATVADPTGNYTFNDAATTKVTKYTNQYNMPYVTAGDAYSSANDYRIQQTISLSYDDITGNSSYCYLENWGDNKYHFNNYTGIYYYDGSDKKDVAYGDLVNDATQYYVEGWVSQTQEQLIAAGYLNSPTKPFADDLFASIGSDITTLVFKSCDCGWATIDQAITNKMMQSTTITSLDYSGVQIAKIESATDNTGNSLNDNGTFIYGAGNYTANNTLTKLVMPHIATATKEVGTEKHYHIPYYTSAKFTALTDITMPDNATCIEAKAFTTGSGGCHFTKITLNEGLKRIGSYAFQEHEPTSIVIPSTVKYIGTAVFDKGTLHDVYFLSETAPIVEAEAFGSKSYLNNNAVIKPSAADEFKVDRSSYVNGIYMAAMLHLPQSLAEASAKRAAYTDITRDYHVFPWAATTQANFDVKSSNSSIEFDYTSNGGTGKAIAGNGNQSDESYFASASTAFQLETNYNIIWAGGAGDMNTYLQNSGYYDKSVGENYRWPSQTDMCRAYSVASLGHLWDNTTTIGAGIGSSYSAHTYDADCDGTAEKRYADGSEYIGLHEFILVTYDVKPGTDNNNWEFEFGGENWWTICVPVSMTVKQVRETFGSDTQVCMFNEVTRNDEKISFYFCDEQCYGKTDETEIAIKANYPYMIRPSKYAGSGKSFTLPDYELDGSQVPVNTTLFAHSTLGGTNALDTDGTVFSYTFIGQYNTQADGSKICMPKYSYYLGADKDNSDYHRLFIQTGETGKWKPFTCVVLAPKGEKDYTKYFAGKNTGKRKVGGAFGRDEFDDDATSVKNLEYEIICGAQKTPVYNLNGQMVNSNNLKKGVYVQNGRTFVVK